MSREVKRGPGRPPVDNPRNRQHIISMRKDEEELCYYLADRLGISRTQVLIDGMKALKEDLDMRDMIFAERDKQEEKARRRNERKEKRKQKEANRKTVDR